MGETDHSDNSTARPDTALDTRPADPPPRQFFPDIARYRPGIAMLAAGILLVCTASYVTRWAGERLFPKPAEPRVVCRAPGGAVETLPRGTAVGEAFKRWGVDDAGISDGELRRRVPDGSRVTVTDTRAGRHAAIGELPAAERYALGLSFDINRATAPDIALIPGVGELSAAKVVAWRRTHGDFSSEADLAAVPGLGADKARTIARHVSFGPGFSDMPAGEGGGPSLPGDKLAAGDEPLDINTAAIADLMRIPGVGEVTAGRIVDSRDAHGPFRSAADLERVKGIGKKKAAAIAAYVRF